MQWQLQWLNIMASYLSDHTVDLEPRSRSTTNRSTPCDGSTFIIWYNAVNPLNNFYIFCGDAPCSGGDLFEGESADSVYGMHCRGGRHSLSLRSTASLKWMNEFDLFSNEFPRIPPLLWIPYFHFVDILYLLYLWWSIWSFSWIMICW